MVRIIFDVFSGRPNPSWTVEKENAKSILNKITNNEDVVADIASIPSILGYRGVIIEMEEMAEEYSLPSRFVIASGASSNEPKGIEIATQIVKDMPLDTSNGKSLELTRLDEGMRNFMLNRLSVHSTAMRTIPPEVRKSGQEVDQKIDVLEEVVEGYKPQRACHWDGRNFDKDEGVFKEDIWLNNCYNYATAIKTNTYAQPGRHSGHTVQKYGCNDVMKAAMADIAWRPSNDKKECPLKSSRPNYLMALVLWPQNDYHWYRQASNSCWGHKPGGTPITNLDNCNNKITNKNNPEKCARGEYTVFCGYLLTDKRTEVK